MKQQTFTLIGALLIAGATSLAVAQNLGITAITDQFTVGNRGSNAVGTGPGGSGGTTIDPNTEFADYSGVDATGTPIRYINAYAGASAGDAANGESPVQNVSTIQQPDRTILFSALTQPITVPANTRPGATSASDVITVGDDGGQNTLIFGDQTSTDYFAQVDFFAIDRSANPAEYEAAYLAIRSCRDGAALTGSAFVIDREPCYALWYDYNLKQVQAVRYAAGGTSANVVARTGVAQQYGSTVTGITTAWHTFRIEATGTTITFKLDGTTIASVTDSNVANGRAALGYRSGGGILGANESAGVFDNL
ncbi:MAG: hypothetical protein V2A74_03195, partial [bacterium]